MKKNLGKFFFKQEITHLDLINLINSPIVLFFVYKIFLGLRSSVNGSGS